MFAVIIAALLSACRETPVARYNAYADVISDNAIARGWIPKSLPATATNVIEQHSLDTNHGNISFKAAENDLEKLLQSLQAINKNDLANIGPRLKSPMAWWPLELREGKPGTLLEQGFSIGKTEDKEAGTSWYFAINPSDGVAYAWQ